MCPHVSSFSNTTRLILNRTCISWLNKQKVVVMKIENIWAEYQGLLRRFLASKVNNPHDAEDLLQQILMKVHQGLSNLKDTTSIKPWLLQISNRTIIDYYRKQADKRELSADELWFQDEEQVENELLRCLQPFILQLPAAQAELLMEVELGGVSQKEYAQKLNLPYTTLKSRVQKSRQLLKTVFEQCCELEMDASGRVIGFGEKKAGCKTNC